MDADRFDRITRTLATRPSRRGALRLLVAGLVGVAAGGGGPVAAQTCTAEGGRCRSGGECCLGVCRKRRGRRVGRCNCPASRECEDFCCSAGRFCCNPQDQICCPDKAECCNPGDGTGSCCSPPNRCGRPYGDDGASSECCPPKRQIETTVGLVRCCPEGTRSLGGAITAEDGPCCPEEKSCGDTCCSDLAPVCVDPSRKRCCTQEKACGDKCCGSSERCVAGQCKKDDDCARCQSNGWICCPPNTMGGTECCPPGSSCVNNATGCGNG